jgi:hypothetical protein
MIGTSERISARFSEWELTGRGWQVWEGPVRPEPPFSPYQLITATDRLVPDDGKRETLISSFIRRAAKGGATSIRQKNKPELDRPVPVPFSRREIVEVQAHLPISVKTDINGYDRLFASLAACIEPVAFELVSTEERVVVQFAVGRQDLPILGEHLRSFFPDVEFVPVTGFLESVWRDDESAAIAIDFGLGKEFMIPLRGGRGDPFVGIVGALSELRSGESAVLQILFEPASDAWSEAIVGAVTHADGSALFVNAPDLLPGAKEKTASPLFAAVVRIAALSPDVDRVWEIACNVGATLGAYRSPRGNELVPLRNTDYPAHEHVEDMILRQTRRSGMILNADELAAFVHLPSAEVRSLRLRRSSSRTKAAPEIVKGDSGPSLGTNEHLGVVSPVRLSHEARTRHIHIIGASGTGKSSLLFNLIRQDIESGEGVSVLDPHGDLVDKILGIIPSERIGDVVLLDPSDEDTVVPFNMLFARSDSERSMLASDLVSVFRRLSTSWGDQLNSVLHNALLAFLESERGGTLHDVRRFLIEPSYRAEFLKTVRDPDISYYWRKAFPLLTGNKSVGPIVTRLDAFLSQKTLRYMVAQGENRIDFRDIMDSRKIFLAKLSQGAIGLENSYLLGSLLVSKIQAEAMSRQRQDESSRQYHFLYADEFHEFLTPSLAQCLSGIRKYRLGLVLGHQEMQQVERNADVAGALLNAYTRVVFRVSDKDARSFENGFVSFKMQDIQNLSTGQAVCRVERAEWDFNLVIDLPRYPAETDAAEARKAAVDASRRTYGIPRRLVQEALRRAAEEEADAPRPQIGSAVKVPETEPGADSPAAPAVPQQLPVPPLPTPELPSDRVAVLALGKGGAQHKAIQDRVKAEGELLGFRVVLEKSVLGGLGQVDVFLAKGERVIACEISVENTIDYEVGNVSKCLKAGFRTIAVITTTEEKLGKLRAAVTNSLGAEVAKHVSYYLPDAFLVWLREREQPEEPSAPTVRTHGGRVVRRVVTRVSDEEVQEKEEEALRVMAQLMRQRAELR